MATSAAVAAAAAAVRARREITDHLEGQNATGPAFGTAYEPRNRLHERQLQLLIRRGIVHEQRPGLYWLDIHAREEAERRRREQAKVALKVIVVLLVVGIAVSALIGYLAGR